MSDDFGHRWLSEAAETLIAELAQAPGDELHCDVLVIGSGYGGAVAAARLAGALEAADGAAPRPTKLWLLERGAEFLPGMFPATFAELPGHVRFAAGPEARVRGRHEGLFDLRVGKDVSALVGNGLGGGSLINAAVMERPGAEAFADEHWPAGMNLEALAPAYGRAEAMLAPETITGSVPKLDSLLAAAAQLGGTVSEARKARIAVRFADGATPAGVAMRACLRCGDCVTGCNHRAKQSLDLNYLAAARAKGARLFCGATVTRLVRRGGVTGGTGGADGKGGTGGTGGSGGTGNPGGSNAAPGWRVEFVLTDPTKARRDRIEPFALNARRVVVAAGTFGSTELLLKSANAGAATAMLGKRFSGNGDFIAAAHGQRAAAPSCADEGEPPAERGIGPTITGLARVTVDGQPRPIVFEEFGIPAPLKRLFGEVVTTVGALRALARTERSEHGSDEQLEDPLAVSDIALAHTPVYGLMGDDGAEGELKLAEGAENTGSDGPKQPPGDGRIVVHWPNREPTNRLFAAGMAALRAAHEAPGGRGGRVLPNPLWQPLPPFALVESFGLVNGAALTVHPLGGCPMGEDRSSGVVDRFGRVFAADGEDPRATLPGLAVLDGSIVPAALGINPALTIAALAEHAVPMLAAEWQLALDDAPARFAPPRPGRRERELAVPAPAAPTTIRLAERMTGRLHFGTGEWACTARVDFAPFDVQWLRRLPRALPFAAVTLELSGPDGQVHRLPCRGEAEVLHRESSTFAERVRRSRELARRKLAAWTADFGGARDENLCAPMDLDALASHLGAVRTIVYRLQVTAAEPGAPLVAGEWLVLTKRLEFTAGSNPWRQLSEGTLTREAEPTRPLGRLVLDLGFFAEQMVALAAIETQQDAPNAIADLAEAGLWLLRIVLGIHFLNFLPPGDALGANSADALPGALGNAQPDTCEIVVVPGDATERGRATLRLSRYVPAARRTARPVLLIHGYGAGGSTFTHPAIGTPLAQTLLASGREVWVLDLRTAIGLEQRRYWSFDEVALGDIPRALEHVAAAQPQPVRIDIVAHCIGAAMFSVAALEDERFARQWVGGVVLSQVGPLLRMSAFNRLRGFVASYLQQYLSAEQLTVKPQIDSLPVRMLLDGVLATFPYPDGDGEAARLATVPGFAAVRHRADAIFGQLMHLPNIGDALLPHLDAIYGWVMTRTLAQTIHYARERLLTDASGLNQVVAFERIAANFGFPVLMLHGRLNAVFDWRGSEDTVKLLSAIFDGAPRGGPAANTGPRRLKVIEGYGHQDCLVGEHAHRDVFPHITAFLDEFADAAPTAAKGSKPVVAALPWMGPTLGHVQATGPQLHCRLAVRPPPARADAFAVVYVPARRIAAAHGVDEEGGIWEPLFDEAVADPTTRIDLIERALGVTLHTERVPQYDGFVVLTVHNDLPVPEGRIANGLRVVDTLFASPTLAPTDEATEAARAAWQRASAAERDAAVVELHASWVTAASPTPQPRLTLALMSCQYPAGIVDSTPAMASQARLAGRIATAPTADKPQRLLLLGDQVYVDDLAGLFNPSGSDDIERAYRANLTLPSWRRVGKAVPVLPLIDDHEIANNWEPGVADLTAPLAAWQRFQHKLLADAGAPPFDRELHVAGVPLFVLDVRTARQARTLRPTEDAALLDEALIHPGGATWQRLRAWLQEVPAERPKLIATSVSIFPFARAALAEGAGRIALDDWGGYPRSLQALLALIAELQVKHVVLLSGDRHLSSVSSLWLETSAAPLEVVSIVASAAYAPWPFANQPPEELWLNGPATFASSARGGHTLRGEMVTAACDTHHGFALVQLREQPGGGGGTSWRLSVELDLADGHILCERNLAEPSRRWQVREQR